MTPVRRLAGRRKRFLTPDQEVAFRRAWESGAPQHECARVAGIPYALIRHRLADQLSDLPRRGRGGRGGRRLRTVDPSPEEIYGRLVAELQSRWSDEDRERAWHGSP